MDNWNGSLVARFGKALRMQLPGKTEPAEGLWLVLGYFDTLRLDPLPRKGGESQIGAMWQENVAISKELNGDIYYHALHMIPRQAAEQDRNEPEEDGREVPFLLLSLVQGGRQADLRNLEQDLTKNGKLSGGRVRCYHTLELSDLVVVQESRCLTDLLERLRDLHEDPRVRDTDTFVAIRYSYLQGRGWDERLEQKDREKRIYMAARYVVRDRGQKKKFMEQLNISMPGFCQDAAFFTTGIEDLHIVRSDIFAKDFLEFLHTMLFVVPADSFREAFSSALTQIGLSEPAAAEGRGTGNGSEPGKPLPDGAGSDPSGRESGLTACCDALLKRFGGVRASVEENDRRTVSWCKPAGNLYSGLVDMSRSSILDGFCYLILDAAAVFCEELRRWNDQAEGKPLSRRQLELIQRFVRGWGTLLEHSTRMDGRFIQMPGLTPSLCEIPARLLEFYLAFAHLCVKQMQLGAEPGEDVAFLLVPKICRRMKVEPIFLNEGAEGKHLLYMDVPLDLLYDPASVMCVICHEAAHFVGGRWRHRTQRQQHLLMAVANELTVQLQLQTITPNLSLKLYAFLDKKCEGRTDSFLRSLKARLHGVIQAFLEDTKAYANFLKEFWEDREAAGASKDSQRQSQMEMLYYRNQLAPNYRSFLSVVDNLAYLFQESYADVSMICLFRLSRSAYLSLARQELDELEADQEIPARNEDQEEPAAAAGAAQQTAAKSSRYYIIAERWSALLRLKGLWKGPDGKEEPFTTWLEQERADRTGVMREFLEDIATVCDPSTWGIRDGQGGFLFNNSASFEQLMLYLGDCRKAIQASCEEGPAGEELRKIFEKMTSQPQLDYGELEKLVSGYRQELLEEYQKKLTENPRETPPQ